MFWRRKSPGGIRYLAVLEITEVKRTEQGFGRRDFEFKLSDGTTERQSLEAKEWHAWRDSLSKGGLVVNAEKDFAIFS